MRGKSGGPGALARRLTLVGAWILVLIAAGCGDDSIPGIDAAMGNDGGVDSQIAMFPDTGITTGALTVARMAPDHGPFTGGNEAVVRGTGFRGEPDVSIGGRMVQPADTELIDGNRIRVVVPAGEPGPADVIVTIDGEEAVLPDGYTYDSYEIAPNRGSVSGGTFLNITGSASVAFADGARVTLGAIDCNDVQIVSATRITCRSPSGSPGPVDVTIVEQTDAEPVVIEDGFTYYDSTDPFGGGLGGGPIAGTVNVTVLNALTGEAEPDAFVIVGEDLATPHQGLTNLLGQITFSGDDLLGPQTVHIAKFCFEKTSIVAFDATEVTVFLVPWMDPRCGMGAGGGGGGRGRNGAFVGGELIWLGPIEYGPNPWDNIPPPRTDEIKVAYVFPTQRCAGDSPSCLNPDPSLGGATQRVLERPLGERGYPYRIFVRPAGLAVYAIAGLENTVTGEFNPYVMGVGRNVLAGPGEEVEGVDIVMNIPLDHRLDVRLVDMPTEGRTGPDRFRVRADIDLGGEGVIVRRFGDGRGDRPFDEVRGRSAEQPFRFYAQPALFGALEDGRYRIDAGWFTGDFDSTPFTQLILNGVRDVDDAVVVTGWIGIPQATAPAFGEPLPADRVIRWTADGAEPGLHVVSMAGGDGNPAWRHFAPGNIREAPIPDLSSIPEIEDISPGFVTWSVYAIQIPGFDFNTLSYSHLNSRLWSGVAQDTFTAIR